MPSGTLVIAGGALGRYERAILGRFIDAAGGPAKRFSVLPAATVDPHAGFRRFVENAAALGVDRSSISLLEVSGSVPGWERGASDRRQVEALEGSDGVWILGGDQNRLTALLVLPDGRDTPLLAALRARLDAGAAIGGTSAGAAVMCDPMIGGGTSFGALACPRASGPGPGEMDRALWMSRGFGLFPCGIVDQHFDARARMGRLVEAVMTDGDGLRPGFGIAEDSAMAWDAAAGTVEAMGAGGVYIVDPRRAVRDLVDGRLRYRGVVFHYLTRGDRFEPATGMATFPGKRPLEGLDPAFSAAGAVASGPLSPYGTLAQFAARMVMDNDPACLEADGTGRRFAKAYLIEELDGRQLGWLVRVCRREGRSRGWLDDEGVSFEGVELDILPVAVSIGEP